MSQKIRIKLKSYDHNLVDKSAEKIVKTVKATGAVVSGPYPCRPTSASSLSTARPSSTRNRASSSSFHHSNVSSTSTTRPQRQSTLS